MKAARMTDSPDSPTLEDRFEVHRSRLRTIAHRMLGSSTEADDAVQEAWLRLSQGEHGDIQNLGSWLTTVVARVCLDLLRARKSRHEEPLYSDSGDAADVIADPDGDSRPDSQLWLADSIGVALLVVLETLAPAERIAFVLHDLFDIPFDDIAPIVGRTATATRQLASRARRRVQSASAISDADRLRQRQLVDAFLTASRTGDFAALLNTLDPDVVLRADSAAVAAAAANAAQGAPALAPELRGAQAVATAFRGRARGARPALLAGQAAAAWAPGGVPQVIFSFSFGSEKIVSIELIMDPARLSTLDVVLLGERSS
jgi:RNA polymerase sigma-70 factor (ECF subfamily)